MDKDTAEHVVHECFGELLKSGQAGTVEIITGRGNNSHNRRSNLKPVVKDILSRLNLSFEEPECNSGVLLVHLRS
jgi:hypothetical protein